MPETDIEQSRQLAEKLRACIFNDSLLREKNITASLGIAGFPAHGSTPQELIQIADASMYLSKHQGGNTVSTAGQLDADEARQWKRNVLEAYLGVTLKRLFSTGPEAFVEIHRRLEQFSHSLPATEPAPPGAPPSDPRRPPPRRARRVRTPADNRQHGRRSRRRSWRRSAPWRWPLMPRTPTHKDTRP